MARGGLDAQTGLSALHGENGNNWKLRKSLGFVDEMNGNVESGVWRDELVGISGKCGIAGVFDGKGEGETTEYAEYTEMAGMVVEMGGVKYLRREMLTGGAEAWCGDAQAAGDRSRREKLFLLTCESVQWRAINGLQFVKNVKSVKFTDCGERIGGRVYVRSIQSGVSWYG